MRLMVLQIPVAFFEVSKRMVFLTMHQYFPLMEVLRVRVFVRSDFCKSVIGGKVRFLSALRWSRGWLFFFLFMIMMHGCMPEVIMRVVSMVHASHTVIHLLCRFEWIVRKLIDMSSVVL